MFVGRAKELAALSDVARRSAAGPSAAVVVGEPGSGKSRLLAEAREHVRLPETFVISGYEAERRVPLAAAAGLLRALADTRPQGARLANFLAGGHEASELEPLRLFEAAHRAFREEAQVLLVVDDVQWVDELSLALCHYLARAAAESKQRVAILVATRPGAPGTSLVDALPPDRVLVLELGPLERDDGVELALALDPTLDHERAALLWEQAEGSPFWLEALARAGAGGGDLSQLLTHRLRGVGPDAGGLLAILAVAGRPIGLDYLAALAKWPTERAREGLAALVGRGIAVETGGMVRVTHDLLREAALEELPEEARRQIHRNLAALLEREAGEDVALLREALEHRRSGGLAPLELAVRIAGSSRRRFVGRQGLQLLGEIADEADPLDPEAIALQESVSSLATELAEHETALARWSLVADRAEAGVDRADALLAASRAAYALARLEETREYLVRARHEEAGDEVVELECRTHEAAILLWLEQRTAEGRAAAAEAVTTAKQIAAREGGVSALGRRARLAYLDALRLEYESAMQEGDPEGLLHAAEQREAAAQGFELESYLTASLSVGVGLWQTGRVETVMRLRRLWDEAHKHVLPRLGVDAGWWLARTLHSLGDLAEAERIVEETTQLAARAGDMPRARHRVARVSCEVALERGRPRDALRRLERETAAEANEHQRIAFHQDVAVWYARLDGPRAAAAVRKQLAAAHACAEAVGCPRCEADLLLHSAEALARLGEGANASRALARRKGRMKRPTPLEEIVELHVRALAEPSGEARVAALESALAAANETPWGLQTLWTRLDLALALAEVDRERAVGELSETAEAAHDRGAMTLVGLAEQALRALGVRTWRRAAAGALLTRREQEVAQLVADGMTNREIAQALFLSPKTVERHVSNVLRKLGARNRTELASRLREHAAEHAGNPR